MGGLREDARGEHLSPVRAIPLSRESGTNKTVKARFWPWLALVFKATYLTTFRLSPPRSAALEGAAAFTAEGGPPMEGEGPLTEEE